MLAKIIEVLNAISAKLSGDIVAGDAGAALLTSIDGKTVHVDTGAVTVVASALPVGASTGANQATANTLLTSIEATLTAGIPVTPAPGAASAAKQDTGNVSLASLDTKHLAAAASADATANPTAGGLLSFLQGYNGATWDRVRTGLVGAQATFTGFLNTIGLARYNAAAPTVADGSLIPLQTDVNGNLKVVDLRVLAAAASADATANPTAGGLLSFLQAYNGATWDRLRTGLVGVQTTFVGLLNVLPVGRYNATPPTLADGNVAPMQFDVNGSLKVSEQRGDAAYDNANGIVATMQLPLAIAAYAWSVALNPSPATGLVVKASPGILKSLWFRVDGTLASSTVYVQVCNTTSISGGTSAFLIAPTKVIHVTGTDDRFFFDFGQNGIFASAGITIGISTTEASLTTATAALSCTALYK